jgi:bifunctional UDP-N-acetylglucosamine pyrophosphorylase/glucosamine-1-phosphate N-acetyltransferase
MKMQISLATIILAAGKGTRMKSDQAKVLHEVFFEPMVHHVVKAVQPLDAEKSIVMVGHQKEAVEQALTGFNPTCVEQKEQNGTGHAVLCAETALRDFNGTVLILCGDSPLLLTEHLTELLTVHTAAGTPLTIVTTSLQNPQNYGRIITDNAGSVLEVVEEKDASDEQRKIKEINAGIYCVEKEFLFKALRQVTTDNSQGEMYLTDIVAIAVRNGFRVKKYQHPVPDHVLGVNSRVELSKAHIELQARRNRELMASGISMHIPATITVAPTSVVSPNCTLTAQITISGTSVIGIDSVAEPGVFINNATIGDNVLIGANSVVCDCHVPDNTSIPPLSRILKDEYISE